MDPSSHDTVLAGNGAGPNERPSPEPGERFAERYRVERMVGRGGMATVYLVFDEMVHEAIALKILDLSPVEDVVRRFRQEVRLSRRITHQNVARTHDIGVLDGSHYLTMEFIDGPSLASRLGGGRPDLPAALRLLLNIADGLGAAHAAGIVHRDLKPENVLIHPSGRAVVTDFGIARAIGGKSDGTGLVGTPLYMSPEQVLGLETDARSDVYALGLVAHELLTGRSAFRGETPLRAALARIEMPAPELPESLPPELRSFVGRCLEQEPEGRPADGAAAAADLAGLIATYEGRVRDTTGEIAGWTPAVEPEPQTVARSEGAGGLRVAVLPLSVRGTTEHEGLAAALGEELLDVLSKTHGVEVLAAGSVRNEAPDADPRRIGREHGVDLVVEGGLTGMGDRIRLAIRLLDGSDGTQRFAQRFEAQVDDPFSTADRLAHRVAEALRVQVTIAASEPVHPRAKELYLQARSDIRRMNVSVAQAVEPLEEVIELAPQFAPALAAHTLACLRSWFSPGVHHQRDWATAVRESLNRAVEFAESQPETQVAVGRLAIQEGRWRPAAQALRRATSMAPTMPDAHAFLGLLQVEAGRVDEGLASLRRAYELDPATTQYFYEAARCAALHGERERYDGLIEAVEREAGAVPAALLHLRVACWHNESEAVRGLRDAITFFPDDPTSAAMMSGYIACILDEIDPVSFYATFDDAKLEIFSPRFASVVMQMSAEVLARAGHYEQAQEAVSRAAETVLLDILWLERCPVLEPLRHNPEFRAAKKLVKVRTEAIWTG